MIVEPENEVLVADVAATPKPTRTITAVDTLDADAGVSPEELVRWAIFVGAKIKVRDGEETTEVSAEKDIPIGRYKVITFELSSNKKSKGITDADFTRLAGHEKLVWLKLSGIDVGDSAFAFCARTPALQGVQLLNHF